MRTIDEERLETDLAYRFEYLADFIGFGRDDATAIQASAPHLGPQIPMMVEQTYERLLAYDATARHFVPRQHGYEGATPVQLQDLTVDHPQVAFRKEHLARYFMQVLGRTCDASMAPYLDMVGKIHTPSAGNREIDVPLVQMNALMGALADVLFEVVAAMPLDPATMMTTLRAYNKFLWIQNDFITRHYAGAKQ